MDPTANTRHGLGLLTIFTLFALSMVLRGYWEPGASGICFCVFIGLNILGAIQIDARRAIAAREEAERERRRQSTRGPFR